MTELFAWAISHPELLLSLLANGLHFASPKTIAYKIGDVAGAASKAFKRPADPAATTKNNAE